MADLTREHDVRMGHMAGCLPASTRLLQTNMEKKSLKTASLGHSV